MALADCEAAVFFFLVLLINALLEITRANQGTRVIVHWPTHDHRCTAADGVGNATAEEVCTRGM